MSTVHHVSGNQLMLLENGMEFFPQLRTFIDAARHSIYLETYIFEADKTGRMIAEALQRAVARGVVVRMTLDGFGSAELPKQFVDGLLAAGIEVQWFRRKISPLTLRRSRLRRLHRKLAVMDGETAFVGGINIVDDIPAGGDHTAPRLDYAVRIQGEVAGEIHVAMRHLWSMMSRVNLHRRIKMMRQQLGDKGGHEDGKGDKNIALLLRDNLRHRHDIERAYLQAIAEAQSEVIIACAYFLPGHEFRHALLQAAQRGVRVVLLLQGKVEYRLQHYATHALYEQWLAANIEIHEYQASYLHAKVAVVDGQWATVGSSNIDPFSLLLAREANLVVRDAAFAGTLRASLMAAISNDATRIGEDYGSARNFLNRLISRLSYSLVRLLVGVLASRRHGL